MSKFYKLKSPNGGSECVNEKYIKNYKKKGYVNTGVQCGSSGKDLEKYQENKTVNNPTVGLPVINQDVLQDIGINESGIVLPGINSSAIADVAIFGLVLLFLTRLIKGVF